MSIGTRLRARNRPPGVADPSTISGLTVWLKADSLALADAAAVSSWVDSSSNALNFAQGTAAQQPTFRTNIINAKPVVRFDGTDDSLSVSSALLQVASRTVLAVCRSNLADYGAVGALFGTNTTNWYTGVNTSEGMRTAYTNASAATVSRDSLGMPTFTTDRFDVLTYLVSTVGSDVRVLLRENGAVKRNVTDAGGMTVATSSTLRIGRLSATANPFNGDVAELLVYNRALTASEMVSVEQYLARRYALPDIG